LGLIEINAPSLFITQRAVIELRPKGYRFIIIKPYLNTPEPELLLLNSKPEFVPEPVNKASAQQTTVRAKMIH
jgi:hypothetical protein